MKKKKNIYWIYMVLDENILICIFNYKHDENARRWRNILFPHFRTMVLDSGNDKVCDDFIQYPNIYYSGLWNEMKRYSEMGDYEWVGIICSDVEIDDMNADKLIDRIKWLKTTKNIGCWSLIGDFSGHSNRYAYAKVGGDRYRCFEGFFQFIRKDILNDIDYIDTSINLYGYGIDFLTCYTSHKKGFINVCQEDISIFHPKDKGYDSRLAGRQSANYSLYIRKNKYPDYRVCAIDYDTIQKKHEGVIEYKKPCLKKCVYTCISGNYDTLKPINQEVGWDYICFTDMDIKSDYWDIREIPDELSDLSPVKKQRMIKLLPERYLSDYDVTIWIDANVTLIKSITDFYNIYKTNAPISLKLHPNRNCIYDECDACIRLKKDTVDNINEVKERYKKEGMPEKYGLYETNIIIRDNRDFRVAELMNMWANEVREHSHRDQLSLTYCMWKLNCKDIISEFSNSVFKEYFKLGYKHTPGNYKKREIIDNIVTIDFEEKKEITDVPVLTDINTSQEEKNSRILCLIEDSVPYYSRALCTYFSEYFDTEIVDCKDRKYSLCYSKLPELSKDYDYVLLIKTNVSFSWANQSYIETIANGAKDVANLGNVGVWGLSNNFSGFSMSDVNNIEGDVGQDQIVLLNSKVIHQAKKLDFSNNFIGAGYTDYLCKVSKSLNYKNLINKRIPLRLYSNIEDFDNNSVISLRNAFNKLNNIS